MLEIIEKQGVLLRFSVPTRHVKCERVISLSLERKRVFENNKVRIFVHVMMVGLELVKLVLTKLGRVSSSVQNAASMLTAL